MVHVIKIFYNSFFKKIYSIISPFLSVKMLLLFVINFIGAIPYYLTGSTLSIYLQEMGFSISAIGMISLLNIPHAIKFLWAHIFDSVEMPFLSKRFGLRRSWMILSQIFIILGLLAISELNPREHFYMFFGLIIIINFFISSYNILALALQMEIFKTRTWGISEAVNVCGFRMGLLVSGAGSLVLSQYITWSAVYKYAALLILPGLVFLIVIPIKSSVALKDKHNKTIMKHIYSSFITPLLDLMKTEKIKIILVFMIFYMLYDHMLSNIPKLFHLKVCGFSKEQIAIVDNIFGMVMTLLGGFTSGILTRKLGPINILRVGAFMSVSVGIALLTQSFFKNNINVLYLTVAIQEFVHGFTMTSFFTYQMSCCSIRFASSQLSVLNSLNSFGKYIFGSISGYLVDYLSWDYFFVFISICSVPSIFLINILPKKNILSDNLANKK